MDTALTGSFKLDFKPKRAANTQRPPNAHLRELGVCFVDGVRRGIDSMSQLLLQKPVGLRSLAYPVMGQSI